MIDVFGHRGLIGSPIVQLLNMVQFRGDALINCAGFTNVDDCETKPDESLNSNVLVVTELLRALERGQAGRGAKFVHLSTDFIFDGENGPYAEDAPPCPISVYGAQKWIAEKFAASIPNHLIIRTTCVYGWHEKKKTFVHWVLEQCKKGAAFGVAIDQFTTPTYAPDLARCILELIRKDARGIYNVVGDTGGVPANRMQFAKDIAGTFGYNPDMIYPVNTRDLKQVARRPRLGGLTLDKLHSEGIYPWHYLNSLEDMANTWKNEA